MQAMYPRIGDEKVIRRDLWTVLADRRDLSTKGESGQSRFLMSPGKKPGKLRFPVREDFVY